MENGYHPYTWIRTARAACPGGFTISVYLRRGFFGLSAAAAASAVHAGGGTVYAVAVRAVDLMLVAVAVESVAKLALVVVTIEANPVSAFPLVVVVNDHFVAAGAGEKLAAVRVAALAAGIAAVPANGMIRIAEPGQLARPVLKPAAGGLMAAVGAVAPAQAAHSTARNGIQVPVGNAQKRFL